VSPKEVAKLEAYLKGRFRAPGLTIRAAKGKDVAAVHLGDAKIGDLTRDDDEGELSYNFSMPLPGDADIKAVEAALRDKLRIPTLTLVARQRIADSVEVMVQGENIATLYREGKGYQFEMPILEIDLEG
jgi:hypothetical protein